ncbi:MAG: STAS domain-containing protein [Thermoleophilia bacterium]|nr:STAS domain-containing protein [Thermoleophilia bacterium]
MTDIVVENREGMPLLAVQGEVDQSNSDALDQALSEAIGLGSRFVLLDVSQLSYMDSAGLSVLLAATRQLRGIGWLGVLNPNSDLRRLFELVGLTADPGFRLFEGSSALADAQAAITEVLGK